MTYQFDKDPEGGIILVNVQLNGQCFDNDQTWSG